jgi:hypothetical protein
MTRTLHCVEVETHSTLAQPSHPSGASQPRSPDTSAAVPALAPCPVPLPDLEPQARPV